MLRVPSSLFTSAIVVSALLSGAGASWAQQSPTGTWANESGGAYFYIGAAATEGTYEYVFGGYQSGANNPSGDAYRAMRRYDVVNNVWTTMADMPQACYYNSGAFYNGQIYSFGNAYYGTGAIYAYNVSTNIWTQLSATLGVPRYYTAAATLGDKIYICGGYYNGYSNLVDEFNPSSNTVTSRATMPGGLGYTTGAAVPALNKMYVMTGYNNNYMAVCYEYTPPDASSANGVWATKTPVSVGGTQYPRYFAAAMMLNNRVYLTGGYDPNSGYSAQVFEYNPITDTWAQRANMAGQRYEHGAVAINGKGYVYGGYPNYTAGEEFSPPSFGSPPNVPTNVTQAGSRAETALQAQADPNQYDGWTNNQISFSASVTDPDANQQVRLRARVKNVNTATWTNLDSGLQNQGIITLNWTVPADGAFDWQYRVEDTFANSYPLALNSWVDAFGNVSSPDFRSDQVPPADPLAISPSNVDLDVHHPVGGYGTLTWTESTDNGPVAGISYEIQVARDGGFIDIEAQIFSSAGTSSYPVYLTVSRYNKYWRLRARDVGGNFSAWSTPLTFRVVYDDQLDHAAGDAKRSCGMAATGTASLVMALLGFAILGLASGRRFFRT
jgi:hypothetical protein